MKIVEQSVIMESITLNAMEMIERVGRTCYKSENCIAPGTAESFVKMIMGKKHYALLEFADAHFRCITNRAIANELVRHRIASYAQESTRYCNYAKIKFENEIAVIEPEFNREAKNFEYIHDAWLESCLTAEDAYLDLLRYGASPEIARDVLPLCTKTEIHIKANFREWLNILDLRFYGKAGKPHPQMVSLMQQIHSKLNNDYPTIFE